MVLESLLGDVSSAALAPPVGAFPNPLERALYLLSILVEQVDQAVVGGAIRKGLGQIMPISGGVLGSRTIRAGVPLLLKKLSLPFLVILVVACQPGSNVRPVPSVAQIGGNLKCAAGDHGFADSQAGWGFCYPATWRYIEKSQVSAVPPGLDLTFEITDIPCVQASTAPGGPSAAPVCSPGAGLFAFMIVSTYQRGDSTSLTGWVQTNGKDVSISTTTVLSSIPWGDSSEAYKLDDGRRIALTSHHVVILDLHSGQGNLDLEAVMSARLSTWAFTF